MSRERITERIITAASESRKTQTKRTTDLTRELEGFEYDKSKAKVLKDALHNVNVSLGTLMAAMKQLSMLRGSDITPDGKIGGRGFIMPFKDIKQGISESVGTLSDITDSIADELKNPKWGLKDSDLKKVEKQQDNADDIQDQVNDLAEAPEPEESETDQPDLLEEEIIEEDEGSETIDSTAVQDSTVLERYRDLLGSSASDRVASVLSKPVLANLVLPKKGN